ncbi:DUF3277 family protein, partial [Acinetobacter baumannii]|nr:DUF3277 family protein [Acinetobacter baumannii]
GFLDLEHIVNLISFGALTAFSFVNFSVISRYALSDDGVIDLGYGAGVADEGITIAMAGDANTMTIGADGE